MKRDLRVYLQDIWESILAVEEYTKEVAKDEFFHNQQLQDAVLRRLEIMGEAVKYISEDFKSKYPAVAWSKIAGLRDVLIHQYFAVNLKRIWEIIRSDLPELKKYFVAIKEGENSWEGV